MSPIALLGLAWMVSVAIGIWVIAALLFLAELRERKSEKTRSLASGFAPTSFISECIGGTETFSKAVETKETAPLCARHPHSSRVLSHSLLGPLAEPPKHRSAERYNNNTQ
jgi:hypothetical protein